MSRVALGPNHPDYAKPLDVLPPATRRGGLRPSGQWSRDFEACQRCGRNDRRYNARGLCGPCYQRAYMAGEFDS